MATAEIKKFSYTPDFLLRKLNATGNPKNTLIKTGAHMVIGVGAGTVGTCILGKWGFLAGLGLIGLGCYKDLSWAVPVGIGMSSSALMLAREEETARESSGFDLNTEVAKAKTRLSALTDSFMSKSYMGKIFKGKQTEQQRMSAGGEKSGDVSGFGELPAGEQTLEEVEKQLVAQAMEFERKQNEDSSEVSGTYDPELMGLNAVDFSRM